MNLVTSGTCRLCGAETSFSDMAHFSSAIFGPVGDLGMYQTTVSGSAFASTISGTTTWACDDTCWGTMKNSERWKQRIYFDHDRFIDYARLTVSGASLATLSGMISLPAELALAESDIDRFDAELRDQLHLPANEWADAGLTINDGELCCRIFRNLERLPTYSGLEGYGLYYD